MTIISEDFHNKKRPSIQFLAEIRNKYLHEIQKEKYESFDIVIAMDMDLYKGIDPRGIAHSFSKINEWDMVCSNGINGACSNKIHLHLLANQNIIKRPINLNQN